MSGNRIIQNRVLVGTEGNIWVNGYLLAQIKSVEIKVTGSFEDVSVCGDGSTHHVYTGWDGEGNLAIFKIDSYVLNMLAKAYQTRIMPDIKIITKLTDVSNKRTERTAVTGVVFTEFMLSKFETKTIIEEELPFKFDNYEVLQTIDD